ncbi:MAG: two-component system, OmpR family, sensor histidine kinase ChvG [Sphingomonadales bacterium]|nr:two-component system, OmpR family, sensor histidine kinase ChvG [Sphingomonadales bacterium]
MIRSAKALLKRFWPSLRLRTILFATLLFVAALPGFGAVFLRVYENSVVRQTEAELNAQGAVLASAYRAFWTGGRAVAEPAAIPPPERPTIDLSVMPVLPVQPGAEPRAGPFEARALAVAAALRPIAADSARPTLAAVRILDRNGRVLIGRDDVGASYAHLPEVRDALAGRGVQTVLRRRDGYEARYWLEFLSRASAIRVHQAHPVIVGGEMVGVIMLSRSPRGLFVGIYQDRGKIALGIGLIFTMLLILAGLLSRGIARPIEALGKATQDVARGPVTIPDPPVTAAIEIRALYENFGSMAARIDKRSRYLRDFAAAVSHEFKTPIAGIRGALELLEDHEETMSADERRRFLANAAADAERLSLLLERLLHLARADMAVAPDDAATPVADPLRAVADAMRGPDLAIRLDIAPDLPPAAAAAEVVEAVLQILVENSRQAGAGEVAIAAGSRDGRIMIRLGDNGAGVPEGDRERVFEPFHTGRREQGGSGLGLSIARSLLASCGGTIANIPAERGACFEIELPAAA